MQVNGEDYWYKFQYKDGENKFVEMQFTADRDLDEIVNQIKQFLLATSWSSYTVDQIQVVEREDNGN